MRGGSVHADKEGEGGGGRGRGGRGQRFDSILYLGVLELVAEVQDLQTGQ